MAHGYGRPLTTDPPFVPAVAGLRRDSNLMLMALRTPTGEANGVCFPSSNRYTAGMPKETVEISGPVLSSVQNLDELLDWLTSQNPKIMAELREARRQDLAGKFKAWKPRHVSWPTKSK